MAEEVDVAARGVLDGEAAHPAVQQTLQVVRVLVLARSSCRTRREQFLEPVEDIGIDQRFVAAGILGAVPLHHADVDRVGEDLGQSLPGNGCGGLPPLAPVDEALVGQLAGQTLQSPVACRVAIEGAGDERRSLRIGDDAGDLVASDGAVSATRVRPPCTLLLPCSDH